MNVQQETGLTGLRDGLMLGERVGLTVGARVCIEMKIIRHLVLLSVVSHGTISNHRTLTGLKVGLMEGLNV